MTLMKFAKGACLAAARKFDFVIAAAIHSDKGPGAAYSVLLDCTWNR